MKMLGWRGVREEFCPINKILNNGIKIKPPCPLKRRTHVLEESLLSLTSISKLKNSATLFCWNKEAQTLPSSQSQQEMRAQHFHFPHLITMLRLTAKVPRSVSCDHSHQDWRRRMETPDTGQTGDGSCFTSLPRGHSCKAMLVSERQSCSSGSSPIRCCPNWTPVPSHLSLQSWQSSVLFSSCFNLFQKCWPC